LLISGVDVLDPELGDMFVKEVNEIDQELSNKGFLVDPLHWKDSANRVNDFKNKAKDKDVIFYSGHGLADSWGDLTSSDFPVDLGKAAPLAFAESCWTGNYEKFSPIVESFFGSGAAVYIGATMPGIATSPMAEQFFNLWGASESIGHALTETKKSLWNSGSPMQEYEFWALEYNLYGDPKFGGASTFDSVGEASRLTEASTPPSSLQVEVPDYTVDIDYFGDGLDKVEIPGGWLWLKSGELRVPFYTASIEYPQGYKVQDVVLADRSGLVTDTGVNIPMNPLDATCPVGYPVPYTGTVEGWFPEEDYGWQVIGNPDGSTTLVIVMYPFYYNPLTTDVRFYKNYSFDISYTVSPVAITSLDTDKDEYGQGDTVLVDIGLNNSGEAQDVTVSALVKKDSTGEIVDGLLLSTLDSLSGEASFSPQWNSDGIEPGYYTVEVELRDAAANLLDRQNKMFRLGISSGEITSFTTTPEYFDIGDSIDLSLTFNNTGTVDISGTVVIKVHDEIGEIVQEFAHDVTDLTPGGFITFDDAWDSTGAEEGTYYINGLVLYDSQAAGPATAAISTSLPPSLPGSPSPANNATGVATDADLSWTGGDPDAGDTVTYDVYFGTSETPLLYDTIGPYPATQTSIAYQPATLDYNTKYYWQIVARDNHGVTTEGDVWGFTTRVSLVITRDLPAAVAPGETFDVTVTFTALEDDFSSILLTDFAPAPWAVQVDTTWCAPNASAAQATDNQAEITWSGSYAACTPFTVMYKVTVPGDAFLGSYTFPNGTLRYYSGEVGPTYDDIGGDWQIEVAIGAAITGTTGEVRCDILPGTTVTLYEDSTQIDQDISDESGSYALVAPQTGNYTVVASKAGFRDETQEVSVTDLGLEYALDFRGEHGLCTRWTRNVLCSPLRSLLATSQ
jgi:hypothetical protein